jgi:molybdopterin-guanine dinucleotide biosynthesis protein A
VDYLQFEGSYGNKRAFTNINSPSDVEKISFDFYI